MNTELVERYVLAQWAVRDWLAEVPKKKRSYLSLADHIDLNSSVHLTWLMRDDHLTPTMERALVMSKLIPPPPEPVLVQPCDVCGEVHALEWCANLYGEPKKPKTTAVQRAKRKRKPRPPRFEVAGNDIGLALKQLEKHYPGEFTTTTRLHRVSMGELLEQYKVEADTPFDEEVDQFDKDLGKAMKIAKRLT